MSNTFQDVTDIYFNHPEKLYDPELVTVLKAKVDIRKPFKISPEKWLSGQQKQGKWYLIKIYRCPTIKEFTDLKRYLETKSNMFMVAGLPLTELDHKKPQRRVKENFRDRQTQYMVLDFDNIDVGLSQTELLKSPVAAIKALWSKFTKKLDLLPDAIPQSVWSLSSSYGKPGEGFNGHATIVLHEPATLAQIEYWFKDLKNKKPAVMPDPVTARVCQPLYCSRPRLVLNENYPEQGKAKAFYRKVSTLKRNWAVMDNEPLDGTLLFLEQDQVDKNIKASTSPSDGPLFEYVISQLDKYGWLKSHEPRDGKYWDVFCPLEGDHSEDTGSSATTLMAPDADHPPGFRCQHANTHDGQGHGFQWFLDQLVDEGVLERETLREIYQQAAREEFADPDYEEADDIFNLTIAELQDRYIYVNDCKSMYDVKKRDIIGMETFRLFHQTVYAQRNHIGTDKKPMPGVKAWALSDNKFKGGASVDSVGWFPGKLDPTYTYNGMTYVNTWKPSHIIPRKTNIDAFLNHINFIFPDEGQADIFLDYLAHTFQKPWERPTWSVLHVSQFEGLGRGLVHSLISSICGRAGTNVKLSDMVNLPYNGYMFQTLWAGIEEVSQQATKLGAEVLKELITVTESNINDKYAPYRYGVPIFTRFFFMTNNPDAMQINDSERRFWVCGPCAMEYRPQKPNYYMELAQTFARQDFKAGVLEYLLTRDISKFNAGMCPAPTELKERMVLMSRTPVDDALATIVHDEETYPPFATIRQIKHWVSQIIEDEGSHINDRLSIQINNKVKKLPYVGGLDKTKRQGRGYKIGGKICRYKAYRNVPYWADKKVDVKKVRDIVEAYENTEFDMDD